MNNMMNDYSTSDIENAKDNNIHVGSRIEWLDFARSMAIVMVVFCHVTERAFNTRLDGVLAMTWFDRVMCLTFYTFGRMGVPLFLFLSGYLLLDRKYESARDVFAFWKKKLIPLVLAFELWTVINEIVDVIIDKRPFDVAAVLQRMTFLSGSDYGHMWYMPMIIGMYLMLPFVSIVVQRFPVKTLLIPFAVGFVYIFIVANINKAYNVLEIDTMSWTIILDFMGGAYGMHIVFGYIAKQIIVRLRCPNEIKPHNFNEKSAKVVLLAVSILSFAATVIFQLWSFMNNYAYTVWYNFGLLFISAASLFIYLGTWKQHYNLSGIWSKISKASLGIYFTHNLFRKWLFSTDILASFGHIGKELTGFAIMFAASFAVVEIISLIAPHLAAVLFLKKFKTR